MPEKSVADSGSHRRPNNNNRLWKWVSGILGVLLIMSVGALIRNDRQIAELKTIQIIMGKDVETNAKWIRDWSAVLKVPERDERQDSNIEQLERRVAYLEQMVGRQ